MDFDTIAGKLKIMLFINTVRQFLDYCIENKIEPTIASVKAYVLEKTGEEISNELIEVILKICLGNVQASILYGINEFSEHIAENMLDKPSNYLGFARGLI